jgi:hypothetical protein
MDIKIKVTEQLFNEIENGKKFLRHGFSKNKKHIRLFENVINNITIFTEKSKRTCIKKFRSIKIDEKDGKKYFEITIL